MAGKIRRYPINEGMLCSAVGNFELHGSKIVKASDTENACFILRRIDSGEDSTEWGRLSFRVDNDAGTAFHVRVFATDEAMVNTGAEIVELSKFFADENKSLHEKIVLFDHFDCVLENGICDILLYKLSGRFLFIMFEAVGYQEVVIGDIVVETHGDNFMETFPEVFRGRDSFFHRYLSILSKLYNDFDRKILNIHELFDIDKVPDEALPLLLSWLGINASDKAIAPEKLRILLKKAPFLLEMKGTRTAIHELVSIFVDCEFYIVENTDGSEFSHYDFSVLLHSLPSEALYRQLYYLIEQFCFAKSGIHIFFIESTSSMDTFGYLDVNSSIETPPTRTLDDRVGQELKLFLE